MRYSREHSRLLYRATITVNRHVTKKNKHRIMRSGSKTWVGKSDHTRAAEQSMCIQLKSWANRQLLKEPISTPIWAIFLFYFSDFYTRPKKKSESPKMSLTLGDLSNLYQLPEDCLQKAGIISNDALIVSHDLSRKLPSQSGRDYLEIFLLDYKDDGLYRGE